MSNVQHIYKRLECGCIVGRSNLKDFCRPKKGVKNCAVLKTCLRNLRDLARTGCQDSIDALEAYERH